MDATRQTFPRRPAALTMALLGAFFLTACAAQAEPGFDAKKEVVLPGWQLAYENINPMIKMAAAYGNRAEGAHGSFGKFPPNFTTPFHRHSAAYHGVVLKGVMTNPFAGEETPSKMSSGSYWYVPANANHATSCISDEPCEFYFYSAEAFDFHVTE